jgi:hypothetical protein
MLGSGHPSALVVVRATGFLGSSHIHNVDLMCVERILQTKTACLSHSLCHVTNSFVCLERDEVDNASLPSS